MRMQQSTHIQRMNNFRRCIDPRNYALCLTPCLSVFLSPSETCFLLNGDIYITLATAIGSYGQGVHVTMKEVASQEASLGWRTQEASDFQPVAQKPLVLTVRKGMQRLSWQKKPVGDKGPPVWVAFPGRAHEVGQEVSLAPLIVGRFRCTPHPRQNSGLRAQKEMTKLLGPEVIKDSGKPAQPSRRSVPH